MRKSRLLYLISILLFPLLISDLLFASVIHQSAILGETGNIGGAAIASYQYVGSRFSVDKTVNIDYVGGHIREILPGGLFVAVVALPSSTALPEAAPPWVVSGTRPPLSNLMGKTTFTNYNSELLSEDVRIPLNIAILPGDYALIFGSGISGAIGFGNMPNSNTDIPGNSSYFFWNSDLGSNWHEGGFINSRFVVTGTVVPIPPAFLLFGSGLLGMIGIARRKA